MINTLERWQTRLATKLNKIFGDNACRRRQENDGPNIEAPYLWIATPEDWHFVDGEKVTGAETIVEAYARGLADLQARLDENLVTRRPVIAIGRLGRGKGSRSIVLMGLEDWMEFLEEWLLMKEEGL
jgi:hypothetical protein